MNAMDVGASAIRALGALVMVVGIFLAGVWLFRKGQGVAWRKAGRPKLAILETRSLGNRFAIYVVGYEDQRFLVGSSPTGLNLLSGLPAVAEASAPAVVAPAPATVSFAESLQQVLRRQ